MHNSLELFCSDASELDKALKTLGNSTFCRDPVVGVDSSLSIAAIVLLLSVQSVVFVPAMFVTVTVIMTLQIHAMTLSNLLWLLSRNFVNFSPPNLSCSSYTITYHLMLLTASAVAPHLDPEADKAVGEFGLFEPTVAVLVVLGEQVLRRLK